MIRHKNYLLTGAILCLTGLSAQAATLSTTPSTSPADGPVIVPPTTGYAVTPTSTPESLSFIATSPGESAEGAGTGTLSDLAIQITLDPEESLGATSMAFSTGSFDDGLFIQINGTTIVDFNFNNYTGVAAFQAKYDTNGGGWSPWANEGNPQLNIDFVANTVELLVDTVSNTRENALADMQGTPTPSPIPMLDFLAGVTFSSAYSNAAGPGSIGEQTLTFTAAILEPEISVLPTVINFSPVIIGVPVSQPLTVSNTGGSTLNISSISSLNAPFSIDTNTCGASLAPAASCIIGVEFLASTAGSFTDSIVIQSNDLDSSPLTVPISASAIIGPDISVSTTAINFGRVVNNTLVTQPLTISNVGDQPLDLSSIGTPAAPFSIESSTCGTSLAVGADCVVTVGILSSAVGVFDGEIIIQSNDPDQSSVTVTLSATVVFPIGIPTLSQIAMLIMAGLLGLGAMMGLQRRA